MKLRKPPSFFPTSAFALCVCLATGALASGSPAPAPAGDTSRTPPPPASCWSIEGPFQDGKETYFEASNQCDSARHCQVWVNSHEPPYLVHLAPGSSGRIDVGGAQPGDTYSRDCAPVGVYGDHQD